jgi:hypothetical protein
MLEFTLKDDDLDAFFAHHAANAPHITARNRRMRGVWFAVFALLAVLFYQSSRPAAIVFGASAIAYLLFYVPLNRWWYLRHNHRLHSGERSLATGRVKVTLSGDQLHVDGEHASTIFALAAILRIEESATHYFLYTGPSMAIIIPKLGNNAATLMQSIRDAKAVA